MPKAVEDLSEPANRVVHAVRARDGLRGKSGALEVIVGAFEVTILDPALRPEFVAHLKRVRGGMFRRGCSKEELLGASK